MRMAIDEIQRRWFPPPLFARLTRRERAETLLLIAVGILGVGFRFFLAGISVGCDDADIWKEHADLIAAHGVGFAYEHIELESLQFNHPPLMGYLSLWARHVAGSDMVMFSFLMKLPGLLVEVMAAALIWRLWLERNMVTAARAFAAYGVCPTLILVSGFHGNTDCAYAGLTLLSFYLMREKNAPLLSGLALAAALNVKIVPVLMIAPLLSQCRSWTSVFRFSLGAAAAIIPFVPFLLTVPHALYRNVVEYNSQQLDWGVHAFLRTASDEAVIGQAMRAFTGKYVRLGRYVIMAAIVATSVLAAFRPQRLGYHVGAAAWALFLVLTPGFGVQYTVCVLPLLFAADLRRAVVFGLLAAAMLIFVYLPNTKLVLPLHGTVQYYPWPPIALLFGVLAWAVLVSYLGATMKKLVVTRD